MCEIETEKISKLTEDIKGKLLDIPFEKDEDQYCQKRILSKNNRNLVVKQQIEQHKEKAC